MSNINNNGKDEVSKETILSLVKDQQKEIKSYQFKLQKIEEKYLSLFKENKSLKKDENTFEQLLELIFNNENESVQKVFLVKEKGTYSLNELKGLWRSREDQVEQARLTVTSALQKEHQALRGKYEQMLSENKKMEAITINTSREELQELKTTINRLEKHSDYLTKEIVDLNDIIQNKDQQIQKLQKVERELEELKGQGLVNDIDNQLQNMNYQLDTQFRQTLNEYKDRQSVLLQRVSQLEEGGRVEHLHQQVQTDLIYQQLSNIQQEQSNIQQEQSNIQQEQSNIQQQEQSNIQQQEQSNIQQQQGQQNNIQVNQMIQQLNNQQHTNHNETEQQSQQEEQAYDIEYLKNIIVKYFIYQKGKYYNEADILMHAILSLLKIDYQSKQLITQAKEQSSLWHSAKNYMHDYMNLTKSCQPQTYFQDRSQQNQQESFQKYIEQLEQQSSTTQE